MSINSSAMWQREARPTPSQKDLCVAIGCHIEEAVEMLQAVAPSRRVSMAVAVLTELADAWKSGAEQVEITNRKEMLDALADQIVTAVGIGHCAGMDVSRALDEVNRSNFSKFVDGKPLFNDAGKVIKGPDYSAPDLRGLY